MFAFLLTVMFAWWGYAADQLSTLSELMGLGFRSGAIEPVEFVINSSALEIVLGNLGMYLYFAVALAGILYLMSRGDKLLRLAALTSVVPLAIGFISMVTGLFVNQQRWFYYSQIMLAIPLAHSFALLGASMKKERRRNATIAVLVVAMTLLTSLSVVAATDNHTLAPSMSIRYGFTDSEITAKEAMVNHSSLWVTDDYYANTFLDRDRSEANVIDHLILTGNFREAKGYTVIIREEIVNNEFQVSNGELRLNYDPNSIIMQQGFSKIYTSGTVSSYY
jgi:hypothetical protein